nr:tryptophan synthase beta chain 1-like [Tanacetum cinerariifolium]
MTSVVIVVVRVMTAVLGVVVAYKRLCRLEGIIPALEASHALAYLEKLCPSLPRGAKVVVNCSGTGYNDATTVLNSMYNQE